MAQQTIEAHRPGAEIYTGDDLCRQKAIDLLEELNLPRGLLPIENVEEIGINRQTGFVWLRQKKALNYTFRKAGRLVSYGAEVTGFVEDRRMRRVTGVKSREMLVWIPLGEFFVNPKDSTNHLQDARGTLEDLPGLGLRARGAGKPEINCVVQDFKIYTGDDLCRQKAIDLLEELNLPRGLPHRERRGDRHQPSDRLRVTGFVEDRRMRRVTGVKSREMLIWIPLGEFFVNPKDTTKITFRTPAGLSKTYPASAFELEEQGNQRLLA
ncbi:unnamed protein product [Spirodela intermedia]|uniref:Uncharacterized protein n=1 Tax=Spirodela intermedia TaxID=51605 RepID=A0A7I8J703_SPIIN|nr:unnamed protein product [Spirodela intermedia]CAA6665834.1 unnamed protein product [Spirodela intermedia]